MPDISQWPKPKGVVLATGPDTFKLTLPAPFGIAMQLSCIIGLPLLLVLVQATAVVVFGGLSQPALPPVERAVGVLLLWASVGSIIWFCGATFLRAWRRHLHVTVSHDILYIGYVGFWFDRLLSVTCKNITDVAVRTYSSGGEGPEPVEGGTLNIEYHDESGNASSVVFRWPGLRPAEWRWVRDELRNVLTLPPK